MGIPDSILHKRGALSEEEWEAMRKHPQMGYEMLSEIIFLKPALDVVLYHHERFDGNGYPKGLKGENIPLSARIFAVTDAYDAMTSDRPYRKACPSADAINEIRRLSGIQFDPKVVIAFEHVMAQNNFLLFKETHPFA
jgi:HD-GYP domain-containing protein (c-di-GMP phosphodiesterase class II)